MVVIYDILVFFLHLPTKTRDLCRECPHTPQHWSLTSPQVLDGTSCLVGAAVLIMCLSEMVVFRFVEQILQKLRADYDMVRAACSFESNKISLVLCFFWVSFNGHLTCVSSLLLSTDETSTVHVDRHHN